MRFNRPQNTNYYRPSPLGGFSFFPPVIKTLLISNVVVWLGTMFIGNFHVGDYPLGEFMERMFALFPLGQGFLPWQLFTYMFMHASFSHIFFNMFALWMFGMELENVWGSRKFLAYYLLCGVGAGISNLLIAPLFTTTGPTIGASGAIYGVLLAFGVLFPDRLIFLYFFVPIKAKYFVVLYMIIELVSVGSMDGIAHFAHLGGALVGLVYLLWDGHFAGRLPGIAGRARPGKGWSREPRTTIDYDDVSEAKVFDIKETRKKEEAAASQQKIDEILEKITRGGYQSLTDEEKKILFEASKKLN